RYPTTSTTSPPSLHDALPISGKIGITGASYGGYMAMMAIGRTPEAWAAAVELFGITDWLTEQQHEDPRVQQYDQSKLGDPVKDRSEEHTSELQSPCNLVCRLL